MKRRRGTLPNPRVSGQPAVRVAVSALSVALVIIGAGAVSRSMTTRTTEEPPARVLPVRSAEVRRVAIEAGDRHVELARSGDGSWTGGAGASPETEGLMSSIEERLFPLQAYRTLPADTSSSEYGLVDPEITFRVEDTRGRDHEILLGVPTFTNGGVYARRSTDAGRLYLVPRRMMDDLRSLIAGRRIDAPNDLPDKVREKGTKHDPTSWWLRQALDAGALRRLHPAPQSTPPPGAPQ